MDKRGVALILAMFVIVAIAIIISASFFGSINENSLLNRSINSGRALWLAEAGLAEAIFNLPNNPPSCNPPGLCLEDNPDYKYSVQTVNLGNNYYQVVSNGTLLSQNISRQIKAFLQVFPVNPNNFKHAVRSTVPLIIKGSVSIGCDDPLYCDSPYYEGNASINFSQLFQNSPEDVRSYANHIYTDPLVDVTPVEGITWVDLSPGQEFIISSDAWKGGCGADNDCSQTTDNGAILIVAGDAQITGGEYYGIIYVMGNLRMAGNPTIHGSVLVESETQLDTTVLTGNISINHNRAAVEGALNALNFSSSKIVSWEELGYNP